MVLQIHKGGKDTEPCPYCQNMFESEGYTFGSDFGDTEPSVLIYIRKYNEAFDLVIEDTNGGDTACRIHYCPKCGKKLA